MKNRINFKLKFNTVRVHYKFCYVFIPKTVQINLMTEIIGDYLLISTIGQGSFSHVSEAVNKKTGDKFAIKIYDRDLVRENNYSPHIENEIWIMMKMNFPNIIKLYETFETEQNIYLVFEFAENGTLFNKIKSEGHFSECKAREYFHQIIDALEFIHSQKVVHRDLKPENILLDKDGNVKISDFGLSSEMSEDGRVSGSCGSANYAAPEVFESGSYEGPPVDIWSSGVILFVMLAGYLPFQDSNMEKLVNKIQNAKVDYPSSFSKGVATLLSHIICPNPGERYTISQIKNDPWYTRSDINQGISDSESISNTQNLLDDENQEAANQIKQLKQEHLQFSPVKKVPGDFHDKVLNFCEQFNEQKSANGPLQSINQKSIIELKNKNQELAVSLFFNSRLHYISMTDRIFDLEELCVVLREIKPMSLAQSLKVFKKPNHKDRYSYLIYFLGTNPEIFSQIIYFELSYALSHPNGSILSSDDVYFFIYNSFPSFYNFFVTTNDRNNAVDLIKNMFKLHFYLFGNRMEQQKTFLSDFVFSLFLATNPGKFYSSSVEPLLAKLSNTVLEKSLRYIKQNGQVVRLQYYMKCHDIATSLIKRMMICAPLLPLAARQLITTLWSFDQKDTDFWRVFLLDTLVCRYIENFVIMENDDMQTSICSSLRSMASNKDDVRLVDELINKLCVTDERSDGVSDAVEIAERTSVFTPRDLTILYSITNDFIQNGSPDTMKKLTDAITGLDKPCNDVDNQFLLVRPWKSDSILQALNLKKTGGFDEFVDITNAIDMENMAFNNEDELGEATVKFTSFFTNITQKLRLQINSHKFIDSSSALESITFNRREMENLGDRLSSGLFFITDEIRKHQVQKSRLSLSCIKSKLLPTLIEKYPLDFSYNDNDLFSPTKSYNALIENVTKRVESLKLPDEYSFYVKKSFFLNFFDKIDESFHFQEKAKVIHIAVKLADFCQRHSMDMQKLAGHSKELVTRAAESFQEIRVTQKVSSNLRAVLNAMSLLRWTTDLSVEIAIAMSGNVDVFAFSFFIGGYFKNDNITNLILSNEDKANINRLRILLHKFTH